MAKGFPIILAGLTGIHVLGCLKRLLVLLCNYTIRGLGLGFHSWDMTVQLRLTIIDIATYGASGAGKFS